MRKIAHQHLQANGFAASIRELVFGIEDSLVSTVGVVVGVAAGAHDARIVVLSGAVLIVVEALSMAAGSFLSSKSHREMLERAIKEEEYEIEHAPEQEREELRDMYRERGFTPDEVEILVRRITSDKKLWLEEMMAKELKINAVDLEEPTKNAFVMGVSYVCGGVIPLAPYLFLPLGTASVVAVSLAAVALFALGYAKGRVLQNDGVKSGMEMLLITSVAATIGYVIGEVVGDLFGISAAL